MSKEIKELCIYFNNMTEQSLKFIIDKRLKDGLIQVDIYEAKDDYILKQGDPQLVRFYINV